MAILQEPTKLVIRKSPKVDGDSLREILSSDLFKQKLRESAKLVRNQKDSTIVVSKEFRGQKVLVSEVMEGSDHEKILGAMEHMCNGTESTISPIFPLITIHGVSDRTVLCPSPEDWGPMSTIPKEIANNHKLKAELAPIGLFFREVPGSKREFLMVQDKENLIVGQTVKIKGVKGINHRIAMEERVEAAYDKCIELDLNRELTTAKFVELLTEQGITAVIAKSFRELMQLLDQFTFIEKSYAVQ